MACPMGYGVRFEGGTDNGNILQVNKPSFSGHLTYSDYLEVQFKFF